MPRLLGEKRFLLRRRRSEHHLPLAEYASRKGIKVPLPAHEFSPVGVVKLAPPRDGSRGGAERGQSRVPPF